MKNLMIPIDAFEESFLRNSVLNKKYGKIPAYGLWRVTDVQNETLHKRVMWWLSQKDFDSEDHIRYIIRRILLNEQKLNEK